MRQIRTLVFLVGILLSSCQYETNGQQPDNTKPMYGEVPKSEQHKEADKLLLEESLAKFKTIDSSVHVYIDNGWRYFYNKDLKTAMKRFNQAWLLDSEYPDSYFGFAALMEMQENGTEAGRFYKMGIEKDKSKSRAEICYQRIADCKEQLGDFKGTIQAYKKIVEINPANAFAEKKLGYFYMQAGNAEDALFSYKKAIRLDPTDAVTYNNIAYLYQTNRNYENAIANYGKAIELDSKYISAYVNRGVSAMEMSNFKAAKDDFEMSVKLDPKTGDLRRLLGLAKLALKDKPGACKEFESAKQLGDLQAEALIKKSCK